MAQTERPAGLSALPRSSLRAYSALGMVWYALRRWPILPLIVLALLVIAGLFAPQLAPQDPYKQHLALRNAPPFWYAEYWAEQDRFSATDRLLGADHVGRDVLSRIIHGARVSLQVLAVSLTTGVIIGTSLGLVAGYLGGFADELIMRLVDVWLALPFVLIALVAVIVLGASLWLVMALLAMFTWASFVRYVRGEVLSLKERDYVALAKVAGASNSRVILRHILPRRAEHHHRHHHAQGRAVDSDGGDAQLHRRRHPRAHARLGLDSIGGALLRNHRVVEHFLPGSGYLPSRHVPEFPRRLDAGPLRPAPAPANRTSAVHRDR